MNFEELGATLRAERERKQLSIDDVANQLKIPPRQLRALENGEVDSLPHPAYVRGFIRSYAAWLGLGQDEIRDALASLLPEAASQPRKARSQAPQPEVKRGGRGIGLVLLLCILAGAGWAAWKYGYLDRWLNPSGASSTAQQTMPTADEFMAARDAERQATASRPQQMEPAEKPRTAAVPFSPAAPVQPPVAPVIAQPEPKQPAQASAVAPTPPPAATPATEVQAPAETASTGETGGVAAEPDEQHRLIITAVEECWVHSNADKTDTRQFSLRKGDTFALTFADSLELKLGNAGGVRLRYDGRDLPPPGSSGQVRTLTFPPKES